MPGATNSATSTGTRLTVASSISAPDTSPARNRPTCLRLGGATSPVFLACLGRSFLKISQFTSGTASAAGTSQEM